MLTIRKTEGLGGSEGSAKKWFSLGTHTVLDYEVDSV